MSVLVTGGTGFVGTRLVKRLVADNQEVLVCTRSIEKISRQFSGVQGIAWDPLQQLLAIPPAVLNQPPIDAVINLMGESVAGGRWTAAKKKRIRDSRVVGTRNLVDGLVKAQALPRVMISASAVGIYGDRGDEIITEASLIERGRGNQFLIDVCQQWESEADRLAEHGVRVVKLRIGIVLGLEGGALEQMLPIFRWGGGGRLGSGQQWVPWIHVEDLIEVCRWAIADDSVTGVINATAPNPIQNSAMTQAIAKQLGRPAILPAPAFALRLALGEFSDELLGSKRVIPEESLRRGYPFRFVDFATALADLLANQEG